MPQTVNKVKTSQEALNQILSLFIRKKDQEIIEISTKFKDFAEKAVEFNEYINDKLNLILPAISDYVELRKKINNFESAFEFWNENKNNNTEGFWQNFFAENSWIISQIFSYSAVLLQGKIYVGGTKTDSTGANIVDFIFKNNLTRNIALIEIKTPQTPLINNSLYRGRKKDGIYSISSELTGGINQILNYKDTLSKDYYRLIGVSKLDFNFINPKSILIIGTLGDLQTNPGKLKSFELFRHSIKDVEVITYDELFKKVEIFLQLFNTVLDKENIKEQ
ncbi:MAG: Shedu immune nuclease family protein [bacterium]